MLKQSPRLAYVLCAQNTLYYRDCTLDSELCVKNSSGVKVAGASN